MRETTTIDGNEYYSDDKGLTYKRVPDPLPQRRCSICGKDEDDTDWQHLIDLRVIAADGEEGFADVTMLLCGAAGCYWTIVGEIKNLGFVDHRHGGINYLEDPDCPTPTSECLRPTEYGRVFINNPELNHEEPITYGAWHAGGN